MLDLFCHFIHTRELASIRKGMGLPRPWTDDDIINTYRFCNVDRNDDRVTQWIHKVIIGPHRCSRYAEYPLRRPVSNSLWFKLVIARLINQPHTLNAMAGSLWWHDSDLHPDWEERLIAASAKMALLGKTTFNAAYIVSTNGVKKDKLTYVIEDVLRPLEKGTPAARECCCAIWGEWLRSFNGMGAFLTNQVITDMRYTTYLPKCVTKDWETFVYPGPGTRRGVNRLLGRDKDASMREADVIKVVLETRDNIVKNYKTLLPQASWHIPEIFDDPNNVSNCFCEFDKYVRATTGEGRPKQVYR